jgi:hypothetical protein
MRGSRRAIGLLVATMLVTASSLAGCTTSIQPVTCEGGPYRCHPDSLDVKFCENEAITVDGADCASLGLAASKPFCVVVPSHSTCIETHYEVKGRDCSVREYRAVREWRECSAGTPTFAP